MKTFIDEGYTNAEIARRLYRSRASITQELKRNARVITWKGKTKILRHTYEPVQAQRRADHLATEAHRKPKIANGVKNIGVSTGTIYNWILKVINERQTFGHWEIDDVMSPQDTQNFVVSFVERKTRFMVGIKAKSRQFEDMQTVLDTFMSKFSAACESITYDRGD